MRGWWISILCALALSAVAVSGCGGEDDAGPTCVATESGVELTCDDNLDNDCDGKIDLNDTDCAACTPSGDETCDNTDNDCDGATDEALQQECEVDDLPGTQTCAAGVWGDCVANAPPAVELCDGADNDGDGQVDEDLQRPCNTNCGTGVESCIGGQWANCDAPAPETEICDGRDNNCDGAIDEGLTRQCDNDCGEGEETCSLGNWFGCDAPRPAAETCDNVDNDCDGQTDESLTQPCADGLCTGLETCRAGAWEDCTAATPAANDAVCDNKDEDCDGQTDEDCATGCVAGSQTACVGVNAADACVMNGVQTCGPDQTWGPCKEGLVELDEPTAEACNGLDDDCNGFTDEDFPRKGDVCGDGPNGAPLDTGECRNGTWACPDGVEVCEGMQPKATEVCNALDDDCDGATDDDLPSVDQENNNSCTAARNMGTISEGDPEFLTDENTLTWTGSIYPDGDVDYFHVAVDEATSLCVPFVSPDDAYEVLVLLYNLPEGVDYDVCIEVVEKDQDLEDACAAERLYDDCVTVLDEDGEKLIGFEVEPFCALSDDTSVFIRIEQHAGSPVSCNSYAVSIWALTVPPPEE